MAFFIFLCIFIHSFLYCYSSYNKGNLRLFSYFVVWYGIIYGLIPCFYFFDAKKYMLPVYWSLITDLNFFVESLIVLIGYIFLFIGDRSYQKKGVFIKSNLGSNYNKLFYFALFLFFVGCLAYYYFVQLYGGLTYVLNNVSQIRSGTDENKNYFGAIVKMFSSFIVYSFILSIFLYYKGYFRKNKTKYIFHLLIISGLIFSSLLDGGRASMIVKFIYVFLAVYFLKGIIKKRYILLIISLSLFVIFFGKTFIFSLFSSEQDVVFNEVKANQSKQGYESLLVYEFNHQFLSLSNFVQNDYDSRYLKDYIIWLFKPMKLIDGDTFFDSISYYNTYSIAGYWQSDIPPGFLGLAFINGGILFVIIQSLITGRVLKFLDVSLINSDFRNNGLLFFIYMYLFNYSWFALQNGDIALIIQSGIVFIIFITYMLMMKKIKLFKYA